MPAGDINAIKEYVDEKVSDIDTEQITQDVLDAIAASGEYVTQTNFYNTLGSIYSNISSMSSSIDAIIANQDSTDHRVYTGMISIQCDNMPSGNNLRLKIEETGVSDPTVIDTTIAAESLPWGAIEANYKYTGSFNIGSTLNVYAGPLVYPSQEPTLLGTITLTSYVMNVSVFSYHN